MAFDYHGYVPARLASPSGACFPSHAWLDDAPTGLESAEALRARSSCLEPVGCAASAKSSLSASEGSSRTTSEYGYSGGAMSGSSALTSLRGHRGRSVQRDRLSAPSLRRSSSRNGRRGPQTRGEIANAVRKGCLRDRQGPNGGARTKGVTFSDEGHHAADSRSAGSNGPYKPSVEARL